MADYASYLRERALRPHQTPGVDGGIAASTAWAYYDNVSAFFDYCLKWDKIGENPAQKAVAKTSCPARTTIDGEWRPTVLVAQRAACAPGSRRPASLKGDRRPRYRGRRRDRDKALAYVLAFTGVRGGEILKDSRDDRRVGLRWADVDIEDNQITILGKNQQREPAQLPGQTHRPLEQLKRVVEPASDEWPVFVSLHAPSMYRVLPDEFERPDDDSRSLLSHCRTFGVVPPALSTNGARSVLKRLCEDGAIEVDGDREYLTLHGARRGGGETVSGAWGCGGPTDTPARRSEDDLRDVFAYRDQRERRERD